MENFIIRGKHGRKMAEFKFFIRQNYGQRMELKKWQGEEKTSISGKTVAGKADTSVVIVVIRRNIALYTLIHIRKSKRSCKN